MGYLLWIELLSSSGSVALEASDTLSVSDSADLTAGATLSEADALSVDDTGALTVGVAPLYADVLSIAPVRTLISSAHSPTLVSVAPGRLLVSTARI